jgi:hypothetical protein
MAVSQAEFIAAKGHFFSLDFVNTNRDNEVTVIAVTIMGIAGSKSSYRRRTPTEYRLLADVSELRTGLPEGWIVSPHANQIEHVNIWPPAAICPFTSSRMPRICWGTSNSAWLAVQPAGNRTLGNFLEVARQVLSSANLNSPAR